MSYILQKNRKEVGDGSPDEWIDTDYIFESKERALRQLDSFKRYYDQGRTKIIYRVEYRP